MKDQPFFAWVHLPWHTQNKGGWHPNPLPAVFIWKALREPSIVRNPSLSNSIYFRSKPLKTRPYQCSVVS